MHTPLLSRKGFKELHKDISHLENQEKSLRAELREIGRAKSRDAKFHRSDVTSNLEHVISKLQAKREILRTAKPLPRKRDRLRVALGSIVDLVDQQGRVLRYTLVDSLEANPSDGRISIDSPLGRNLLNKTTDTVIAWNSGLRRYRFQLVAIR